MQAPAWNFIKKETLAQVFSCEFCEISKNTFFAEHLRTSASVCLQYTSKKMSVQRSSFLQKLLNTSCNFWKRVFSREFSRIWNNNKKRPILQECIQWNHVPKNFRGLLCIFFKKETILLLSFQKQPPNVF